MSNTVLKGAVEYALDEMRKVSQNAQYRDDPVRWAEEVLGVTLWSVQKEILNSLVHNKKTAVKSCHSIGKTFISAVAACWWASTRSNSMVRSTAPSSYQVHELLWEEIRKFHAQHSLVGRVTQSDEWKRELYGTEIQIASGRKPSDTNIHSFHGVHRPDGVLVILDEGCGIPQTLYTASDAITTGPGDRVLAVGNPDDPDTEFGRIFNESAQSWNLITVSAYATPLFTGEVVPNVVANGLIQPDWVEERRIEWGEDSARFKAKILAEFPDQSSDALFTQQSIDRAYDLELEDDYEIPVILGVDVAAHGDDISCIYSNRGGRIRFYKSWTDGDVQVSADIIVAAAISLNATEVRIDGSGFGSGVVDRVLSNPESSNFVVIKVMGANKAADPIQHLNARAEQYDFLRKQMLKGEVDLDRDDEAIRRQLLSIKYFLTNRSAIQIESKKDMRSRGVKSPDELDAVVYAAADFSYLTNPSPIDALNPGDRLYADMESVTGGLDWWVEGI